MSKTHTTFHLELLLAIGLVLGVAPASAQESAAAATASPSSASVVANAPLQVADVAELVELLARALEERYVDPDTGTRYATMLRGKLAQGDYKALLDPQTLMSTLTADLKAVSADRHLRLFSAEEDQRMRAAMQQPASGDGLKALADARMIGDVAYLSFNLFPFNPEPGQQARQFLLDNPEARALIIDARTLRGGTLTVMDALLPLLYGEPSTLVHMSTRAAAANRGGLSAHLQSIDCPDTLICNAHIITPAEGPNTLRQIPVYYLTSQRTASAGEHLALALKRTGRATLIGETTAGAGHYGGPLALNDRFSVFMPTGRTYDPDTDWDWEGAGVSPDVPVAAADALETALQLASAAGADPHQETRTSSR